MTLRWFWVAYGCIALLAAMLYLQVQTAVSWNELQVPLWNLLQVGGQTANEWPDVMHKFAIIAAYFVGLEISIRWISSVMCVYWRKAATMYYAKCWVITAPNIENASQLLAECTKEFPATCVEFGKTLLRSVYVLYYFGPILWELSGEFKISFLRGVPGALLLITFVVAVMCSVISYLSTVRLNKLEFMNQTNEANLRTVFEKLQSKTEVPEAEKEIENLFDRMLGTYLWTFFNFFLYDFWMTSYRQLWGVMPVAFFGMFVTNLTVKLGIMSKTLGVIGEVHGALIFLANWWPAIQRWRAVTDRIRMLESGLKMNKISSEHRPT
jgi:ABC-type long-subunit fatty acid transport system fused permease/ATPase subunit